VECIWRGAIIGEAEVWFWLFCDLEPCPLEPFFTKEWHPSEIAVVK